MSKILYLSRSIYPKTGGSAFVSENLARNFDSEKFVVVGEKDFFFNRKVEKREYSFPKVHYIKSALSLKNRGERFFAPLKLFVFPFSLIKLLYICRKEKVKSTLIVYPDGYYMYLGYFLHVLTKFKFSIYFHNTYYENRKGINKILAYWVQNKLFKKANRIYLISEGLKGLYVDNYPTVKEKMRVLPHSFTRENSNDQLAQNVKEGSNTSFTFTGNFNESNLDATRRMVNALKNIPNTQINFCTPVPKILLEARGIDTSAINYLGYLDEVEYAKILDTSNFVVLTHGFKGGYSDEEYKTIFPTRTLPLLNAKSPLIVYCPENSFLSTFLDPYNCCHLIYTDNEIELAEKIVNIMHDDESVLTRLKNKENCLNYFDGRKSAVMLLNDLSDE